MLTHPMINIQHDQGLHFRAYRVAYSVVTNDQAVTCLNYLRLILKKMKTVPGREDIRDLIGTMHRNFDTLGRRRG